jgi:hypothetical protein
VQVDASGVMHSAIGFEEGVGRGGNLRKIIRRSRADPDCHTTTLSTHEPLTG